MRRKSCYALVCCTLSVLAGLATAGSAMARVYTVRDQADLIKDKAVLDKINATIREIDQRFGKEVLIETFSSVPPADVARVKSMSPDERKRYFFERARGQAKSNRVNGFYIFANKSPFTSLEVLEDNKTDRALPIETKVRDAMWAHFKKDDFAGGFLKGVTIIRDELVANPAAARNSPAAPALPGRGGAGGKPEVNWGGIICIGLAVILVIWLIVGLIRGMSGRGAAGAGAGMGGGGGGGFMTGLLGGLFGAMAGNWLYHNMFGGGSGGGSQAYGDSGGTGAGDTDYTGAGGDWDNAGGGGGDAGGDWGGGGGDWGGGGGDWGGGGGGDW